MSRSIKMARCCGDSRLSTSRMSTSSCGSGLGQVTQFGGAGSSATFGDADGFADRDGAYPAEQRLRVTQLGQSPQDHDQGLLGGVGALV